MLNYFKTIGQVSWALCKGLGVTLRHMFSPALTVQYPYEKVPPADRFRGALAFHPDLCICCEMCTRACPSQCITMESLRNEQTKRKELIWYRIDFSRCHFCALCEESCPTKNKSIHHTSEYELTFNSRKDFVVEWTPKDPQPSGAAPGQVWTRFLSRGQKIGPSPEVVAATTPSAPTA